MLTMPNAALRSETRRLSHTGDLLSLAPDRGPLVYLECPARGVALLASGIAVEVREAGPQRFAAASLRLRALLRGSIRDESPGPIAIGGFAFEDEQSRITRWRGFGSLSLVVPRRTWLRRGDRIWQIDAQHDGAVELEPAPPVESSPAIHGPIDDRGAWR